MSPSPHEADGPQVSAQVASVSADEPFRLLVDAVEEYAIFMLDADGTVVTWNAGARRIKGYDAEEILGVHFSVFYTDADQAAGKPARELATAAEEGQYRDVGWRVRKDGSRFWANVVITALFDHAHHLTGFAKITRDETERRRADGQVRELELLTDRERIANELYQSVVHKIFDASLTIQGALGIINDPVVGERIRSAVELLDEALKDIRSVVLDITP